MSQQQSSSHKNICVITNCDSLLGYALAYRFLEGMRSREDPEIADHKLRILCRNKSGYELSRLEQMGAEVVEVDYKDEDKMRHAMKNVFSVLLIPENSENRLKEAHCLIKMAKNEDVEHFGLMSFVGVDRIDKAKSDDPQNQSHYRNFKEYREIEECVKKAFSGNKHCICRHSIFNQLYYFLAPVMEGKNMMELPVKEDAKWNTVDMIDVVEAVYCLAKQARKRQQNNNTHKQLYEFTGQHNMASKEMCKEIGEGLGNRDMKYRRISSDEMKQMLLSMRDDHRFKERPKEHGDFKKGKDGFWSMPLGKFLNNHNIETMLEYWCLANENQQDYHSNDLQNILNRQPRKLKEYFEINRDHFKRFK
ncbi:uncharacterized protein BX663DRAFT_508471 [Cokeromyces recurvatus]|uniref:uncharacterized protein n=1 Tax=Cokeromyces recurvatus TaxID=90255 RepID=UPI00221E7C30|nr:uncharacterized protein BX663DRAFT_508471 [Cokeromyces recurvatus]KAI7903400.1 hypothetical protein BX663DRAFT_508471 [Cokeromyces recurvatus]